MSLTCLWGIRVLHACAYVRAEQRLRLETSRHIPLSFEGRILQLLIWRFPERRHYCIAKPNLLYFRVLAQRLESQQP